MTDPLDRLEERFATALALPARERASFIEATRNEDPALATEIAELLKAYETSADFLEEIPLEEAAAAGRLASGKDESTGVDEIAGARIGRYRVIEKIGEGGCGVVYLAEQEQPVQRRVALKVIKLGMDTRAVVARFEAERQALALMDHPNIARVFDAGETERGRPFFVMELVGGVPITRFCDEQRLGFAARLELFAKVCQAIQHAHQKGVIHRDIKPSNVLVGLQDGVVNPKIIDFGIAKATDTRLTERTLVTEIAQLIGTPAYMSPEQLDLGHGDIDTRSDVYALGALLYELLTGRTPFGAKELLQGGFDRMRQRIREEEPVRPSAAVVAMTVEARQSGARSRSTDPVRWAVRLRGELDWIVMRCLEKDRARRYATASALADDIRRHLQHEPVTAAAPSRLYLVKKFARRHRAAVVAALAFAALLMTAVVVSAWLAARATQAEHLARQRLRAETAARDTAERERARAAAAEKQARDETLRATAINDFLQNDILFQATAGVQADRNLTVREAVDAASRRIEWKLVGQPLVELALRETMGRTYVSLGEYGSAGLQFGRAISLAREHLGPEHERTLSLIASRSNLLRLQGRVTEAEQLSRELLAMQIRLRGPDALEAADLEHQIAALLLEQGRAGEAEPLIRGVLATYQRSRGAEHAFTLNAKNTLANVCYELGKLAEAEQLHREGLEVRARFYGADSLEATYSMNGVAAVLRWKGGFADAIAMQRKVAEVRARLLGPEHPDTLAALNSLAYTLGEEGGTVEAADLVNRVWAARGRVLGSEHPVTLLTAHTAGVIHLRLGRFSEGLARLTPALEAARRILPANHAGLLSLVGTQGELLLRGGQFKEAEQVLRANLTARVQANAEVWNVSAERALLGAAIAAQGRRPEAEPMLLEAMAEMRTKEQSLPASQRHRIADTRESLVQLYSAWGRPGEAAKWAESR